MRKFAFEELLAASQARERTCRERLGSALAAAAQLPAADPAPGAGSAASFALDEASRSARRNAVRRALDALAAARRQAAPFEELERRCLESRVRRMARSEAGEADEANRMLQASRR